MNQLRADGSVSKLGSDVIKGRKIANKPVLPGPQSGRLTVDRVLQRSRALGVGHLLTDNTATSMIVGGTEHYSSIKHKKTPRAINSWGLLETKDQVFIEG